MPVYAYRCRACGSLTDQLSSITDVADQVICQHCGSEETHRIISRVAYHASEATKTAKLDPKYDKMVDGAMKKSESADLNRVMKKMKPFPSGKEK